ncbi:MAG TPA: SAM-dependent methyltransferase, partial [Blastocatellia bacterium]|nr:SAM-dependent methyltransferase [Blastocatellia bacterium]
MTSPPTPLEREIVAAIERGGPITFRDFMQTALYDVRHGYYNTERPKIGPGGDYYTSSNVHPAFGAILARCLVDLWFESQQSPLTLVEMGAGTGRLALDILTALGEEHEALAAEARYIIVETSPVMIALQRERLAAFEDRVEWRSLEEIQNAPLRSIFFSNELVDALPVHRVRLNGSRLEEMYITTGSHETGEPKRLRFVWSAPSTEKLSEYLDLMQVRLSKMQEVEIGLDAIEWLAHVARAIERGFLITTDYGDIASHLYSQNRMKGTIRSFYSHRLADTPFDMVGERDITASVNFTALIEYGRRLGL